MVVQQIVLQVCNPVKMFQGGHTRRLLRMVRNLAMFAVVGVLMSFWRTKAQREIVIPAHFEHDTPNLKLQEYDAAKWENNFDEAMAAELDMARTHFEGRSLPFVLLDRKALRSLKLNPPSDWVDILGRAVTGFLEDEKTKGPYTALDKGVVPPNGDKREFMTLVPYAWECSKRPEDCVDYGRVAHSAEKLKCLTQEWIICDGRFNREVMDTMDYAHLAKVIQMVEKAALSYHMSGNTQAVGLVERQLRAWFLDPTTSIHPRLLYSQIIPFSSNPDRAKGSLDCVIDWYDITRLLDGVSILQDVLNPADLIQLQGWFADFLAFITKPDIKTQHYRHLSNHGPWYDVVTMSIARWIGASNYIRAQCETAKYRVKRHISPNGDMHHETARFQSVYYYAYTMDAFVLVAHLSTDECDLLNFEVEGASIAKLFDYISQHVPNQFTEWPHKNTGPFKEFILERPYRLAARYLENHVNNKLKYTREQLMDLAQSVMNNKSYHYTLTYTQFPLDLAQ